MARGMNHIFLIGALARDPELRYSQNGLPIFEATVAGENHVIGHDGQERKLPFYHRVNILGKPAEWQSERGYTAGTPVMVEGTVEYNAWETPEGQKRSIVRVKGLRMEQLEGQPELIEDAGGGVRMAGGMNELYLVGNLTRDPELRYTPSGDAVLAVGMAVNESWTDRNGQKQEKVHWIDVTLWRELAEDNKDLTKGAPIMVMGRLMNESWTDRDGQKRSSTKVEATRLVRLQGNPQGGGQAYSGAAAGQTFPRAAAPAPAAGVSGYAAPPAAAPAPAADAGGYAAPPRSGGLDIDQGLNDIPPEEDDMPF